MSKRIELTGEKIGKLLVESVAPSRIKSGGGIVGYWNCLCECGTRTQVSAGFLLSGHTKSCGCLRVEVGLKKKKEAELCATNKPQYQTWVDMVRRCHDRSSMLYKNYGARGIAVCNQWRDSFWNFYRDMGPKPPRMSIDRINNSLGYTPENCRWATAQAQARNRRNSIRVIHGGKEMSLVDLAAAHKVPLATLYWRHKNGRPLLPS